MVTRRLYYIMFKIATVAEKIELYKINELASGHVNRLQDSPLVRLTGIEPAHVASEATALSTELQAYIFRMLYKNFITEKQDSVIKAMQSDEKICTALSEINNNNIGNIAIYYYTKNS